MEEVEINTEKLIDIELKSDKNNTYLIEFFLKDSIKIVAKLINNIIHKSFSNVYSFEQIRKNKYFLNYYNISQIFNELTDLIYDNKIQIKENENNLIINISLPKNQEIIFELKLNDKHNEDNLNELIFKLNNELNDVKNENKQLKNKIAEIQFNETQLKNENIQLKKEIKQLKERLNIFYKKYDELDSNIINGNELYIEVLNNWIAPLKAIKAELLYRLSENGDKFSTFHELCDNKGPTLILFHVNDGNIVGIYTPLSWDSTSGWKNDMDTFIFNLNKKLKCKKIISEKSVYCNCLYGPTTASLGYSSSSPINNMNYIKHWSNDINKYYDNGADILPSNNDERIYELIEVEIYKIIIE